MVRDTFTPHIELKVSSIDDSSDMTVQSNTTMPTPTNTPCVAELRYESTNFRAVDIPWLWLGKKLYSWLWSMSWRPNPRPIATSSANAGTIESTVE